MNGEYLITILLVLSIVGLLLIIRAVRQSRDIKRPNFNMPRLAVLDDTRIDKDRRLVLVRRDNVEHLLLIGGGSDVVIEQYAVGNEPYRQISDFEDGEGRRQTIESKTRVNQLQLDEKSIDGGKTNENPEMREAKTKAASDSSETAPKELPPIIDDLINFPIGSDKNEESTAPKANKQVAGKNLTNEDSPNDSEIQLNSAVATTSEEEQNENAGKSSQPVDEKVKPLTGNSRTKNATAKSSSSFGADKPKKGVKSAADKEGIAMLEKLQERQTREPVPSNRVPNFISEINVADPVESQSLGTTVKNQTNNLSAKEQPAKKNIASKVNFPGTLPEPDEEVFDKIGKEMTKILAELKKEEDDSGAN